MFQEASQEDVAVVGPQTPTSGCSDTTEHARGHDSAAQCVCGSHPSWASCSYSQLTAKMSDYLEQGISPGFVCGVEDGFGVARWPAMSSAVTPVSLTG